MMDKSRVNKYLGIILLTICCAFASMLVLQLSSILFGPSKLACTKKACLKRFLEGPPAFNDVYLKNHLLNKFFYQSEGKEYNLRGISGFGSQQEEVSSYIRNHFQGKRGGTFVVVGAGDGEFNDFTLELERNFGWNGLLIEPHPELFKLLKSKNRKALLCSAAVSPFTYPSMLTLGHVQAKNGETEEQKLSMYRNTALTKLLPEGKQTGPIEEFKVQSVPLENLIYAAGIEKNIDLLVLDMSGTDLDLLLNVRMDRLPDMGLVVVNANGSNLAEDIPGYFIEKNMVIKKVIGANPLTATFILGYFTMDQEL